MEEILLKDLAININVKGPLHNQLDFKPTATPSSILHIRTHGFYAASSACQLRYQGWPAGAHTTFGFAKQYRSNSILFTDLLHATGTNKTDQEVQLIRQTKDKLAGRSEQTKPKQGQCLRRLCVFLQNLHHMSFANFFTLTRGACMQELVFVIRYTRSQLWVASAHHGRLKLD